MVVDDSNNNNNHNNNNNNNNLSEETLIVTICFVRPWQGDKRTEEGRKTVSKSNSSSEDGDREKTEGKMGNDLDEDEDDYTGLEPGEVYPFFSQCCYR